VEVGGKFEVRVKEAQKAFMDTNEFFGAYATMDKVELLKLISDAHVRTVMWIHGKKALTGSRKEFGSLDAILSHLHDAVAKHMASAGRTLPPWPMLKDFKAKEVNVPSMKKSGMRTITNDASIADIDFETRGFKVGVFVQKRNATSKDTEFWKIADVDGQQVRITPPGVEDNGENGLSMARSELCSGFKIATHADPLIVMSFAESSHRLPGSWETMTSTWRSNIMSAIHWLDARDNTGKYCELRGAHVYSKIDIPEGKLCATPFSDSIVFKKDADSQQRCNFGVVFQHSAKDVTAYAKNVNNIPKKYVSAFFQLADTVDPIDINVEFHSIAVTVNCRATDFQGASCVVNVPIIRNMKDIAAGCKLFVKRARAVVVAPSSAGSAGGAEPPAKRHKGDGKGKAKGEAKGKGKGGK